MPKNLEGEGQSKNPLRNLAQKLQQLRHAPVPSGLPTPILDTTPVIEQTVLVEPDTRIKAAEGLYNALHIVFPKTLDESVTPESLYTDAEHLVTIAQRDPHVALALNESLHAVITTAIRPPQYGFQMQENMKPLAALAQTIRETGEDVPMLEAVVKAVVSEYNVQERTLLVLNAFEQTMEAFGVTPSDRTEQPLAISTLKKPETNSSVRGLMGIEHLHEGVSGVSAYRIEAPLLVTPEPTLTQDEFGVTAEIPLADSKPITYTAHIAVREKDAWRLLSLAEPVPFADFRPEQHIPSQMLGPWTSDLPETKTPYAIVIQAEPWEGKVSREVPKSRSMETGFTNPEDEETFIQAVQNLPDVNIHVFTKEHTTDTKVQLSAKDAKKLKSQLLEAGREDILALPVTTQDTWESSVRTFHLAFCTRIGTIDSPNSAIPASIQINAHGTVASEMMHTPDPLADLQSDDQFVSTQAVGVLDQLHLPEDTDGYIVVTHAMTHRPLGRDTDDRRMATNTRSKELSIQPLSRGETLSFGREWMGNLIEVVPTIAHTDSTEDQMELVEKMATIGDVLDSYEREKDDTRELVWATPQIALRVKAPRDEWEDLLSSTTRGMPYDFDTTRGGGGVMFGGGRSIYTGAATTLGEEKDTGKAFVSTVSVDLQCTPMQIRLVGTQQQAS